MVAIEAARDAMDALSAVLDEMSEWYAATGVSPLAPLGAGTNGLTVDAATFALLQNKALEVLEASAQTLYTAAAAAMTGLDTELATFAAA